MKLIPIIGGLKPITMTYRYLGLILIVGCTFLFGHWMLIQTQGNNYPERILAGELLPEALLGLVGFPMLIAFIMGYLLLRKPRRK